MIDIEKERGFSIDYLNECFDLIDKGWLTAMKCIQNNIDMLEAQGSTND